jgi:predicted ferric reductase
MDGPDRGHPHAEPACCHPTRDDQEGPVGRAVTGAVWAVVYLLAAITPMFFMLVGDPPPGRGLLVDLSIALGFVGLAMLGLQFAITARANTVDASYGLDVVLQFHRQISYTAFAFVLAHPILLFVDSPDRLSLLAVWDAPWRARFGVASVVLLIAIVVTSIWRQRLHLSYEAWRVLHGVLALAIVVTALLHVELVGYYVSGPWRRGLWIVWSLALVALLVKVRIVTPLRMRRRPWRVREVERLPGGTWHVWLDADGHDGIGFEPGQFAWLTIGRSPFRITEHPFSLSWSAERSDRVRFTIAEAGDFTRTLGAVAPGTTAHLDGPYGAFSYERAQAEAFVFLAGGIGVTPMLSMLHTLADRDDPRPMWLFYANPRWADVAIREELDALAQRLDLRVVHVLEHPPEGWTGATGRIHPELLAHELPTHAARFQYFVCGPEPMMDAVEALLHERGVPPARISMERFDFID